MLKNNKEYIVKSYCIRREAKKNKNYGTLNSKSYKINYESIIDLKKQLIDMQNLFFMNYINQEIGAKKTLKQNIKRFIKKNFIWLTNEFNSEQFKINKNIKNTFETMEKYMKNDFEIIENCIEESNLNTKDEIV